MKNFFLAAFAAMFVFGLSACERETEIEMTPGEPTEVETNLEPGIPADVEADLDEVGAEMREGIGNAAAETDAALDEAGAAIGEGADRVGDAAAAAEEELEGDGN